MLSVRDLEYELPESSAATAPAEPRESARLMVVSRGNPSATLHQTIADLPQYFRPGDLLVMNHSRVIAARFVGRRTDTGGGVEGLFLDRIVLPGTSPAARHWRVMLKARRLKQGMQVALTDDGAGIDWGITLQLVERSGEEGEEGAWVVAVTGAPEGQTDVALLDRVGLTPLPPYIRAARKRDGIDVPDAKDRRDYQTVYAAPVAGPPQAAAPGAPAPPGSVAAPTAGLHLTAPLLQTLRDRGVQTAEVVLHVGTGTFKPVETEFIEQHPMHGEWCEIPASTAVAIASARREGRRIIAIGTTSARTLESFAPAEVEAAASGPIRGSAASAGKWTRILITPGHRWQHVDGMLTNFHLPRSTLMAMVGALLPEGTDRLRSLYADAVSRCYRFYSYGDAMLLID